MKKHSISFRQNTFCALSGSAIKLSSVFIQTDPLMYNVCVCVHLYLYVDVCMHIFTCLIDRTAITPVVFSNYKPDYLIKNP